MPPEFPPLAAFFFHFPVALTAIIVYNSNVERKGSQSIHWGLQLDPLPLQRHQPMPVTYKIAKALNGGLWKWTDGEEKVFTILGPIRAGRVVDNPRNGIAKAPDILSVRDAADGNDKEILVGQVLKSTLVENYPDDDYVGRTFACTQSAPPAGKRYKQMTVNEVEVDDAPAPKKAKK
jgi:hypothetical protein